MTNSLQQLIEKKNKFIKISFFGSFGFFLINDVKGKHYIYLYRNNRYEDKLAYLSQFENFTISRGMTKDYTLNAHIEFKSNQETIDIIEKFILKFLFCATELIEIKESDIKINMKPVIKKEHKKYIKYMNSNRCGYIPL